MASRSSNRAAVPEAKSALDKFKYEVANRKNRWQANKQSAAEEKLFRPKRGKALGIDLSAFFC